MKKIALTFLVFLVLLNAVFVVNFFWSLWTGVWFLNNAERHYNSWNISYNSGSYDNAIQSYNTALDLQSMQLESFETLHNLGNSYYQNWELEQSIASYEAALARQQNWETQKNLEFVKSQLRQQQEDTSEDAEEGSSQEQDDQSQGEQQESQEDSLWSQSWWENQELSKQAQQILEKRADDLEASQDELQKYYNQNYQQNNHNSILERLFDNSLLNSSDKKDW